MNKGKTYKIYSQQEIRRYLNGEMSSAEMYDLEKQAIEDPFLADAIDGYNSIVTEAYQEDIQYIRKNLEKNKEAKVISLQKKPTAFPWLKLGIAASVIGVLVVVGLNFFQGKKEQNTVAANKSLPENTSPNTVTAETATPLQKDSVISFSQLSAAELKKMRSAASAKGKPNMVFVKPDNLDKYYATFSAAAPAPEMDQDKLQVAEAKKQEISMDEKAKWGAGFDSTSAVKDKIIEEKNNENVAVVKPAKKMEAPKTANAPVPGRKEELEDAYAKEYLVRNDTQVNRNAEIATQNNTKFNSAPNGNMVYNQSAPLTNNDISYRFDNQVNGIARSKSIPAAVTRNYRFNYKVTDNQGNHIPYTNVSVPADQLVTYTRVDGKFGLFSTDSVLKVNIKAAGYQPLTVQLKNNTNVANITLTDLKTNENVVVVGDLSKAKTSFKSAKLVAKVEEAEPLDGLDNYSSYIANNINVAEKPKGEVVLSFDINKTGEPTNIVVNQSLSQSADQEAIRLLAEGPKWKNKKRKKSKGKIVINF